LSFDPEFGAQETLDRLGALLTAKAGGSGVAEEIAIMHLAAHGVAMPTTPDTRCKEKTCELAGIALAYCEIKEWLDWTTNEAPLLELGQRARDFASTVTQHPFLPDLRRYLHQNYSRFHPTKDETKHGTRGDHEALCETPAWVLYDAQQLVRSVESFVDILQIPPTIPKRERGTPGRPKQSLFRAVVQHLYAGGYSAERVAEVVGCSEERTRNAIRTEDERWHFPARGTRDLPNPRNG
jgi:hypothetical protein